MGENEDVQFIEEIFLKGVIAHVFEQLLSEDSLRSVVITMKALKPAVSSVDDAVFGHVIGELNGRLKSVFTSVYKRDPTTDEVKIIVDTIIKKSMKIRSEVRKYSNR